MCPMCRRDVVAKCGDIVEWHWAHVSEQDCDPWAEPHSGWHWYWQRHVPQAQREVVMGPHRADIVAADGTVVELQHSYLSPAEIAEREAFYGAMVWVFDAWEPFEVGRFDLRCRVPGTDPLADLSDRYRTFRWKHARATVAACRAPVFLDLEYGVLLAVKLIGQQAPVGGWGYLCTQEEILATIMSGRGRQ